MLKLVYTYTIQKPWTERLKRGSLLCVLGIILLLTACSGSSGVQKVTGTPQVTPTRQAFSTPITYVALGASDAVGVGSNQPVSQGYAPLIANYLPKGSHLLDLGVSGIHLHAALSQELPLALSNAPQLVTIWLVANDFVAGVDYQSYQNDLQSLLSQLRSRTQAQIVMANLPDLTLLPLFSGESAAQKAQTVQKIKQWNQGIAKIANQYHTGLVDLFQQGSTITAHPEYISGDGFHPSSKGYAQLAQLFWQVIQKTA